MEFQKTIVIKQYWASRLRKLLRLVCRSILINEPVFIKTKFSDSKFCLERALKIQVFDLTKCKHSPWSRLAAFGNRSLPQVAVSWKVASPFPTREYDWVCFPRGTCDYSWEMSSFFAMSCSLSFFSCKMIFNKLIASVISASNTAKKLKVVSHSYINETLKNISNFFRPSSNEHWLSTKRLITFL